MINRRRFFQLAGLAPLLRAFPARADDLKFSHAVSLGTLLAKADKDKGAATAKACQACHDFTKGGPPKVGPNLYDVVGRGIGTAAPFVYSEGFKTMAGKNWTYEELDKWLTKPSDDIKGTKMAFGGISKAEDRANVLAYLGSLSDSPKPFPAP